MHKNNHLSAAARKLAKLGARKGGLARAQALTPERRREIARRAIAARWQKAGKSQVLQAEVGETAQPAPIKRPGNGNGLPRSVSRGLLTIGQTKIECHVLNDGRRVLTRRGVTRVLSGGHENGHPSRTLSAISSFHRSLQSEATIQFKVPQQYSTVKGYEGTFVIEVCQKYLEARDRGELKNGQLALAKRAELVLRTCAKVGIVALIDEATGYQQTRARRELELLFQASTAIIRRSKDVVDFRNKLARVLEKNPEHLGSKVTDWDSVLFRSTR